MKKYNKKLMNKLISQIRLKNEYLNMHKNNNLNLYKINPKYPNLLIKYKIN